jgi:hypothetical protein
VTLDVDPEIESGHLRPTLASVRACATWNVRDSANVFVVDLVNVGVLCMGDGQVAANVRDLPER